MGDRGSIASRPTAIAGVAFAALLLPAGAAAHPAYVDRDTSLPEDPLCLIDNPCDTIAEGVAAAESALAVIVDDSAAPYDESAVLGGGKTLVASNFDLVSEGQTTIDGGASNAVTVPAGQFGIVSGFNLRGNSGAVSVQGSATIGNNTFDDPQQAANGDVEVLGPGPVTLTSNVFTDADSVTPDTAIRVANGTASANLSRNTVSGYETAVDVGNTTGAVTLNSDLLFGNGTGLALQADVSVTNATFWDNDGTDIANTDAQLTLDSSVVEDPIATAGGAGCTIAFSRGPLMGTGCDAFQTTADPEFVNPGGSDFHLDTASPMIDAGNPDPPTASRDIDGDPRALDGDGACPAERDIGADEFVVMGTPLDCSPPPDPQPQPQPQPQPGDAVPPETVIETGPAGKTKSSSASFMFTSSEPGSTFECGLDGGPFQLCTPPHNIKVKKGTHRLEVRARDAAGNLDSTPASWSWTFKKKKRKK